MSEPSKKMKAALKGVISQANDPEASVTKLEQADKYINDREREAAACEQQSAARTTEKVTLFPRHSARIAQW